MDDILNCPICDKKLKNYNSPSKTIGFINKTSHYKERICSNSYNHLFILFTDQNTNQIDYLRFNIDDKYSQFIELDFVNSKSRISLLTDSIVGNIINIPKILYPDFPKLLKLKDKISLYITIS